MVGTDVRNLSGAFIRPARRAVHRLVEFTYTAPFRPAAPSLFAEGHEVNEYINTPPRETSASMAASTAGADPATRSATNCLNPLRLFCVNADSFW